MSSPPSVGQGHGPVPAPEELDRPGDGPGRWNLAGREAPIVLADAPLHVAAVIDGYAYGYKPAIGGVGLDLRRIALPTPPL